MSQVDLQGDVLLRGTGILRGTGMLRQSLRFTAARRELYQAKLGMYSFLAGLVFVFFSALMVYAVIRTSAVGPLSESLKVPIVFYVSTLSLVGVSLGLHWSVREVQRERIAAFRRCLLVATGFGLGFFVCQLIGMAQLLEQHFQADDGRYRVFGIAFFLAMLHALHVVAGFGGLGYVMWQGFRGRYDHERHWPVDICATYWHFLDAVWLVMLVTMVVIR